MVKSIVKRLLYKLKTAAESHENNQIKLRCADTVFLGQGSRVEFRNVHPIPGAKLLVGDDSYFRGECYFNRTGATVKIGARTYCAGILNCAENIEIGDDVLISSGGMITDHQSHALNFADRRNDVRDYMGGVKDWSKVPVSPVRIEDKVWIGFQVIILAGVTIGEGAVVGAGSVVTRSIPRYTLAVGNPAKVIKSLSGSQA